MSGTADVKKALEWTTIDEILAEMDGILKWTIEKSLRSGYFAALYRKVTLAVKKAIAESAFDDGARMERLDVIFAGRYLEAFRDYYQRKPVTASWKVAFDSAKSWSPIVLQHLLLGMNAHINLDLGIAAALTAPGDRLEAMKADFYRINEILIRLMEEVENTMAKIWWAFDIADRMTLKTTEALARFSMIEARNQAWETARRLAYLNEARQMEEIAIIDRKTARFAKLILNPGFSAGMANFMVRTGERGSIPQIIMTLA